jgi:hypothetical protein
MGKGLREMMYQTSRRLALIVALCAPLVLVEFADAAFTNIQPPSQFNQLPEDGHRTIFGNVYGGTFVRNGVNMTNGTVTATRIDDSLSNNSVLGLVDGHAGQAADQVWHDGFTNALAKVRFAKDNQAFGFFQGPSGPTDSAHYTKLFDVSGSGYNVTGTSLLQDMVGLTFRWGRSRGIGGFHSSLPADNHDDQDHMVTYQITGLPDQGPFTVWMLFWEDRNVGETSNPGGATFNSDRDLNDLVVEIRATAIPEPATAVLGLAGLSALWGMPRRRRMS